MSDSLSESKLELLRAKIDLCNENIIKLLAERFVLTRAVGTIKANSNLPSLDVTREDEILAKMTGLARQLNLNPNLIHSLFKMIMSDVRAEHDEIKKGKQKPVKVAFCGIGQGKNLRNR